MNEAARMALQERARRRTQLSSAAEEHVDRLSAACRLTHPPVPASSIVPLYLRSDDLLDSSDVSMLPAVSDLRVSTTPQDVCTMTLLMHELQQRAVLQLMEATRYSDDILQPFATGVVHLAIRKP